MEDQFVFVAALKRAAPSGKRSSLLQVKNGKTIPSPKRSLLIIIGGFLLSSACSAKVKGVEGFVRGALPAIYNLQQIVAATCSNHREGTLAGVVNHGDVQLKRHGHAAQQDNELAGETADVAGWFSLAACDRVKNIN